MRECLGKVSPAGLQLPAWLQVPKKVNVSLCPQDYRKQKTSYDAYYARKDAAARGAAQAQGGRGARDAAATQALQSIDASLQQVGLPRLCAALPPYRWSAPQLGRRAVAGAALPCRPAAPGVRGAARQLAAACRQAAAGAGLPGGGLRPARPVPGRLQPAAAPGCAAAAAAAAGAARSPAVQPQPPAAAGQHCDLLELLQGLAKASEPARMGVVALLTALAEQVTK